MILLVAATATENLFFSVVAPLRSRSLVLQLHPLRDDDVRTLVHRALADPRGLGDAVTRTRHHGPGVLMITKMGIFAILYARQ